MSTHTIEAELMDRDEQPVIETTALTALARAEIDGQVATAHAFPRSLTTFMQDAKAMIGLDEEMAEACIYSLERKDRNGKKTIIAGPSARFAEIVQHAWGNNRGGGRVVDVGAEWVTAQGVFHDLEKNTMVTMEVQRRIVGSNGKRFGADMIGVTGNAAASIAHRNAVLKGVPKALWLPLYNLARRIVVGDATTLTAQRAKYLAWFQHVGVDLAMICATLGVGGEADIGIPQLEQLAGLRSAIKEGANPVDLFTPEREDARTSTAGEALAGRFASKLPGAGQPAVERPIDPTPAADAPLVDAAAIEAGLRAATSIDALDEAGDLIRDVPDELGRVSLRQLYNARHAELEGRDLP